MYQLVAHVMNEMNLFPDRTLINDAGGLDYYFWKDATSPAYFLLNCEQEEILGLFRGPDGGVFDVEPTFAGVHAALAHYVPLIRSR